MRKKRRLASSGPSYVAVEVTYVGATNYKGSRIRVRIPRDEGRGVMLDHDCAFTDILDEAAFLIHSGTKLRPTATAQSGSTTHCLLYKWHGKNYENNYVKIREFLEGA